MKRLLALMLALLLAFTAALPILAVEEEEEVITYPTLTEGDYNKLYVSDDLVMAADFFRMNGYWNTDGVVYTVPIGPSLNKAYEYDADGNGETEIYDLTKAANRDLVITAPLDPFNGKTLYDAADAEWKAAYKSWINSFVWTALLPTDARFNVYGNTTNKAKEFAPVTAAEGYLQFRDDYHTSGGIVFENIPANIKNATNELVISLDKFSSTPAPNLFYNIRVYVSATEKNGVTVSSFATNSAVGGQYYITKTIGETVTEVSGHDTQALARAAIAAAAEAYAAEQRAAVTPQDGVTVTFTAEKVDNDNYTVTKSTKTGTAAAVNAVVATFTIKSRQNPSYELVHNPDLPIALNQTFTYSQSIALKDGNDDYMIRTQNGTVFSVSAPYNGSATSMNNTNYIGWGTAQSNMKMYAYRHYARVLSDAELVRNHFADLCKWFRLDVTSLYGADNALTASPAEIAFLASHLVNYTFEDEREVVAAALAEAIDAWEFEGEGEAFELFVAAIEAGTIDGEGVRALPESYHSDVYAAYKTFVDNAAADADHQKAVDDAVASILSAKYADYYNKTPALTADTFFAEQTELSEAAKHFYAIAKENSLDMSVLAPVDAVIRERIYETFADVHRNVFYHTAILQARLAETTADLVEYYFGDGLVDDVLGFMGYQIKLVGDQSFRAVFSIDKDLISLLESHGYKVTVGILRRETNDTSMIVEKVEGEWTAVDTKVTQTIAYESGKGYNDGKNSAIYPLEINGESCYAYEVTTGPLTVNHFLGYVTIEREGNEDTVYYCSSSTENFKKGAQLKSVAKIAKEKYGFLSANIQSLTKGRTVLPVVYIGGQNLSFFKVVTDEATAAVSEAFIDAFKTATGASLQTVDAAACTAADVGLIRFVAGEADSIALRDGNVIFTYTEDGSAALAAFAASLAAPEEGYATFAYGDEEPWPVCLLATEHLLEAIPAE